MVRNKLLHGCTGRDGGVGGEVAFVLEDDGNVSCGVKEEASLWYHEEHDGHRPLLSVTHFPVQVLLPQSRLLHSVTKLLLNMRDKRLQTVIEHA